MICSDVVSNGVWISDLREERVRPRGLSLNLQQASTLAQQILEARMLMHQINYHLQWWHHTRAPVQVPGTPLPTRLPTMAWRKAPADGPNTWAPAPTWETWMKFLALGLATPCHCSHLGNELRMEDLCLSISITLSNKKVSAYGGKKGGPCPGTPSSAGAPFHVLHPSPRSSCSSLLLFRRSLEQFLISQFFHYSPSFFSCSHYNGFSLLNPHPSI